MKTKGSRGVAGSVLYILSKILVFVNKKSKFSKKEPIGIQQAKSIAYQIAAYYAEQYQILYAVHIDAEHLNIHFVMNTVSYRTGMKYEGKKQDYYQFIDHMKQTLGWYGLNLYVFTVQPE